MGPEAPGQGSDPVPRLTRFAICPTGKRTTHHTADVFIYTHFREHDPHLASH